MNVEKKIKILEISGGLSTEGIGVFLLNTFENIDKDRFQLDFALATKYEQVFEERIKQQGGKIYRTFEIGEGIKGKIKHAINLYKLIKREKYQVVHSHMDFFNGVNLLVAFLARVPMRISHAHVANNFTKSFSKKIYYFIMKLMINLFSNKKLGCSENALKNINSNGKVIFNGVDLIKFNYHNKLPNDIYIDFSKLNIITVGRIDDQKNPSFIVDIIRELKLMDLDFHFYWVGNGSLSNNTINKASQNNVENLITFLGVRKDVENILPSMNLFLMPSKFEGFPIVLVEAQACNLKCLISDVITEDINVGLCTKLSLNLGAKAWAEKIYRLTNEKREIKIDLSKIDIKNTILELQKEYTN